MNYLSTGVIAEGTTHISDAIQGLLDNIKLLEQPEAKVVFEQFSKDFECTPEEHLVELLDELEAEALQFCPDYTFFGNLEGDGACYGLWADVERAQEEVRDGEIADFEQVDDDYVGLALHINDHGNVSLLNIQPTQTHELWAVV
jgi:hypothetical protein